jgi:hypothetical protein
MAEEQDPSHIGCQIAMEYLSQLGWAREWRRTINRQIYPGFAREDLEIKQRQCDEREAAAEEVFSREVEVWRKNPSKEAKEVLRAIVDVLGKRNDLGFFGKRIVERLKQAIAPF